MRNNKIVNISIMFLVISLIFIIPLNSRIVNATERREDIQNLCGASAGSDVKSSLILSIVTMCLPGILEKAWTWKNIKCQTVTCYYNAVKNNLDPSFCTKQEGYRVCKEVVGEMFAIPPMAFLEYWRKAISNILANPIGTLWGGTASLVRYGMSECLGPLCSGFVMKFSSIFLATTDIAGLIQTIKDTMENGFFGPTPTNYCDDLDDIRDEMEEILEYSS